MKRIGIHNLPPGTSEEELYSLFDRFGPVLSCAIQVDPSTHAPTGAAVIELEGESNAAHALDELQGQVLNGAQIQLCEESVERAVTLNERGWTSGVPKGRAG